MNQYDVAVIGCGAMGSSVSYNLARSGLSVLALEQFGLNHKFGSSHGKTRIVRTAYYEDPRYVPLLKRAFESWRELESKSGRKLLTMTGGLMIGREDGELVPGVLKSAKMHALPHKVLSSPEAASKIEALTLDESFTVVFEENAGVLFPEACIEANVELAKESECEFRFSEPVTRWSGGGDKVELESADGRYSADKVVFCSGPWTQRLIPGVVPLTVERQVPFWFSSGGQPLFSPEKMPIFIMEETAGHFFYGIPEFGDGVKVARTHEGKMVEPETVDRNVTVEDSAPIEAFVSRRLKLLGKVPTASTTCLYSNTPDFNFVVGRDPRDPKVYVVSACSGHGFKFASVIGEVVADMVADRRVGYDLSFLSPERFSGK